MDTSKYEIRAELLKAVAHPARLMMVDALAEGEKCVYELQELVGSAMPTISRHLDRMKSAGIVAGRRDSNRIYYRLLVPCITNIFPCLDEALHAQRS